ncbi:LacI family DNA-binding transcriptional regulator [Sungkyunkwania multivorans]|uniref:LacI family DNA-binding transcriptional regulator n=1 Tax=Sungkyunkwania multivorans TaxID=1173618 RepID=A0ABW3CTB4_9FLAO
MKEVTLKDIAQILGISVTTVSKALKGYKDVSPETRKSVLMLAENLNYKPNAVALNLKNQETRTIGVIVPEIVHNFFSSCLHGIIAEAEKNGYLVIILQSGESDLLEQKQLEMLVDKRVDGILIAIADATDEYSHIQRIIKKEIPIVLFDKVTEQLPCSKVTIDDKKAAYNAVKVLIDSGCKKIAHLRGPLGASNAVDRHEGYVSALEAHGIAYDPSLVYMCDGYSINDGKQHAEDAYKENPDIDGVFCITDMVAAGAIAYFNEEKISIPDQISVMGFSNSPISSIIRPSLSTVDQPGRQMGKEAVSLLIEEIVKLKKKEPVEHYHVQLPTNIVVRDSVKSNPRP